MAPDVPISVVIVTFRRPMELAACLASLRSQTLQSPEIVVVDNAPSGDQSTREVCEAAGRTFSVRYVVSPRNSLPAGRNLGVRLARGALVALIDDDVRIGPDYLRIIKEVFQANPAVVGVQGYIEQGPRSSLREFVHRVFGLYRLEPNACRVLPSISSTYPASLDGIRPCQWLSGSNQVYRREVLAQEIWDEKLLKYADGEDLDLSYRIHKRYPGGLVITPLATVVHDEVATSRVVGRELIFMREVYGWYLLNKLFAGSATAKLSYLWSRIGRLLIASGVALMGRRRGAWSEVRATCAAYWYVIANRRVFAAGQFDEFNRTFLKPDER